MNKKFIINKKPKFQYIIRKYVVASSASEALKLDHKTPPHDIWIDDDWKKKGNEQLSSAIGFVCNSDDNE